MSIAVEVCDYFQSLIKPLVTNEFLGKLSRVFLEIVKRLEEKLDVQNTKIIRALI